MTTNCDDTSSSADNTNVVSVGGASALPEPDDSSTTTTDNVNDINPQEIKEPFYENGTHLSSLSSSGTSPIPPLTSSMTTTTTSSAPIVAPPPSANLIILNTPPSPTRMQNPNKRKESILDQMPLRSRLAIPGFSGGRKLGSNPRAPISDPASPNVPWHPELDRRHSDSTGMTKFTTSTPQTQANHTYQNTTITLGNYSN